MRRQIFALSTSILVVLLGLLAAALVPQAGGGNTAPELRRQAEDLRVRTAGLVANEHSALLDLYALESRWARARQALAAIRTHAAEVRVARRSAQLELGAAHRTLAVAQRQVAIQLRLLYEQGESRTAIGVMLGSATVDEVLAGLDDLSRSSSQSRDAAAGARAAQRRAARLSRSLADRQRRFAQLEGAAAATETALASASAERASYLQRLRAERGLNLRQIDALEARAREAQVAERLVASHVAAQPLAAAPAPAAAAEGPAPPTIGVSSGASLTVSSTGYALPGSTATGVPVGWGVIAVDPSVIPLGTRITIPGYGDAVAADVGPAVHGPEIDLWFPSAEAAVAWGRRPVTITFR